MTDGRRASLPGVVRAGGAVPTAATVAVAATTVLVLLVAVWAASAGPDDPLRGGGPVLERVTTAAPTATGTPTTQVGPTSDRDGTNTSMITSIIGWTLLTVAALLGLAALWLLAGALARVRPGRLRRRHAEPAPPPLEPALAVAATMVADAADQEGLLSTGTPRNAVVRCWHRFEVQAGEAGLPRQPWETSAEFTLRVLELVEADATSVMRLSELYREARFSDHELGEDARAVALEVLRDIHRDLRTLLSGGRR